MKIFVSGSTGYIGSRLALQLAEGGHIVHALYRSDKKAENIRHENIILFKGDILNYQGIYEAIKGCDQAYHVAAFAGISEKYVSHVYRLNVEGSSNVIRAAINAGVKKMVVTSTAGVFGTSGDEAVNETSTPKEYFIHYERSKAIMENMIKTIASAEKMNITIVNPTRVYGPGILSESNGVTRMIKAYRNGRWRIIPGDGKAIGNYVFIDDVIKGHLLAMSKGKNGEKYILGGENLSYNEFFQHLSEICGRKRFLVKLPVFPMMMFARIAGFLSALFNTTPMITTALVKRFVSNFVIDQQKAIEELNYLPSSFKEGAEKTIQWLS